VTNNISPRQIWNLDERETDKKKMNQPRQKKTTAEKEECGDSEQL
jgi:hypothetical protein